LEFCGFPFFVAGENLASRDAVFAVFRIATTSARVTDLQTVPGPLASSAEVTFPASSIETRTLTVPPSPLSTASFGTVNLGVLTIFAGIKSGSSPNLASCPQTPAYNSIKTKATPQNENIDLTRSYSCFSKGILTYTER
jgi:hypothetical protein